MFWASFTVVNGQILKNNETIWSHWTHKNNGDHRPSADWIWSLSRQPIYFTFCEDTLQSTYERRRLSFAFPCHVSFYYGPSRSTERLDSFSLTG